MPNPLHVAGIKQQGQIFGEALELLDMGTTRGLRTDFDKFRCDHLDTEEWDRTDDIARLAITYEKVLTDRGLIDFEVMAREAVMLVEQHAWVRECLRARFPVLVVDEYQDLGWSKPVPGDRSRQGPSRFLREMHKKLEAAEEESGRRSRG